MMDVLPIHVYMPSSPVNFAEFPRIFMLVRHGWLRASSALALKGRADVSFAAILVGLTPLGTDAMKTSLDHLPAKKQNQLHARPS